MKMQFRAIVMFFLSATLMAQANASESLKVDTKGVAAKILEVAFNLQKSAAKRLGHRIR